MEKYRKNNISACQLQSMQILRILDDVRDTYRVNYYTSRSLRNRRGYIRLYICSESFITRRVESKNRRREFRISEL